MAGSSRHTASRAIAAKDVLNLRRLPITALLACLALSATGCGTLKLFSATQDRRGEMADEDALKELIPGTSSRADVQTLLGSPTAKATFDDLTWLYIGQITHTRIGQTPGIATQKIVILRFDQGGILRDIKELHQDDSREVAMAPGTTPSPGSEANFMQQLLGNVGRFTPAGLPGQSSSSIGTGPSTGFGSNTGNTLH
jgi:outer membrane protein assembly factor BamE (lipoprotein component of BamABCDE complex)